MQLKTTLLIFLSLVISWSLLAQDESNVLAYIQTYKSLAIAEQLRSGIPAAITLAQGIHESSAGLSELATIGNNHFGIKCKSTWMGETMLHDDDKKQECFRKYTNAEQSYIDHSDFLKGSNRYHFLFDIELTDYAAWASGLKRAGYATNPLYVKRLTDLVVKYNLQQYTFEAISKSKAHGEFVPIDDTPKNLTSIDDPATYYKGLKGFWANKGETLLPKALEKNIRYAKLLSLNDLGDEPLQTTMFIFTEKKRKIGTEEFHVVKQGENMQLIAQKEAMLLSNLYAYNNLMPGQEPLEGEKLSLQYKSYDRPKIKEQFLKELEVTKPKVVPALVKASEKKTEPEAKSVLPSKNEQIRIIKETEPQAVIKEDSQVKEEIKTQPVKIVEAEPDHTAPIVQPLIPVVDTPVSYIVMAEPKVAEEIIPIPVENNPVVKIETSVQNEITKDEGIIDAEKAKRMEQLLNSKPLDQPQETITHAEPAIQKSNQIESPFTTRTSNEEENKTEKIKDESIIAAVPVAVKRTYDEPDVDDSVKSLKKKFDQIVYSPRPVRIKDTVIKTKPSEQKIIPVQTKQETKQNAGGVHKANENKANVQITKTGIKRDLKKGNNEKKPIEVKAVKKPGKNESVKGKKPAANAASKKTLDKSKTGNAKLKNKKTSSKPEANSSTKKNVQKTNITKKPVAKQTGKKPNKKK